MASSPPNDPVPGKGLFPTTRWTVVKSLGDSRRSVCFVAWEDFCKSYHRPLFVWLLSKTSDPAESEELLQTFFVKINGKRQVFETLDPSVGLLRSWLLTCLRRHWIDHLRVRKPSTAPLEENLPAPGESGDSLYDREWAFALARRVTSALRDEYLASGKPLLYASFLRSLEDPGATDRAAVCAEFSMTENHYAVSFMRFRERLAVLLRQEVAATIMDGDHGEIDAELRHLIRILARHGGFEANPEDPRPPAISRENP